MKDRKKYVLPVLGIIIIAVLALASRFSHKNSGEAQPASLPAASDAANKLSPGQNTTGIPLKLPAGFSISVFAKNLGNPRVITFDDNGTMLVSIPAQGKVVAMPDRNKDGVADEGVNVLDHLNRPHGIVEREGSLWVAESDKVSVYEYDAKNFKATNPKKIIDLPNGGEHFTRTLLITSGRNPRLLVAIGSDCNVCNEKDPRRASIWSANLDGSDFKPYATGLRNSVFMTLDQNGKVWATDMGRDYLGDNLPPDDVNIIEEGKNYGWPICYGNKIHDTQFDKNIYIQDPCKDTVASKVEVPAHSAPLGLAFIPKDGWPENYQNNLLVAYHGSWNRSAPTGYKIVMVKFDGKGNYTGTEDFISGWGQGKQAAGRPVDIVTLPGGIAYISDDKAGMIYKLSYPR